MKAVFVIDVPNELDVNNLLIDYCVHTKGEYKTIRKGGNHPLKPMPKKKPFATRGRQSGFSMVDVIKNTEWMGWNDCIDEILGETE